MDQHLSFMEINSSNELLLPGWTRSAKSWSIFVPNSAEYLGKAENSDEAEPWHGSNDILRHLLSLEQVLEEEISTRTMMMIMSTSSLMAKPGRVANAFHKLNRGGSRGLFRGRWRLLLQITYLDRPLPSSLLQLDFRV